MPTSPRKLQVDHLKTTNDALSFALRSLAHQLYLVKGDVLVKIDGSRTYQTVLGFGGAFTDSVGINLRSLSAGARQQLLRAYYADEGRMPVT